MTYRLIDRVIFMSQSIYAMDTDLLHGRALEIVPQNNIKFELLSNKSLPKGFYIIIYYITPWFTCVCCDPNQQQLIYIIYQSLQTQLVTILVVNPLDFI